MLMRPWFVRSRPVRQVVLVTLCCAACALIRVVVRSDALSDPADLALQLVAVLALIALLVATMRAALAGTSRRSRIGLAALPVAIVLLGGAFARASYADASCELQALIAAGEPNVAPTTIVLGPTGQDVRLSGVMREGGARALADLLDRHREIRRIHLTSEGGLAEEGQAIGNVIAAHGLTTYVPDYCVSACTLAFVRGRERLMQAGSRVGFHAPYLEGLFGQIFQDDASAERAAYIAAGVTPAFATKALSVASGDMWFPDADRLVAAHVATGVVDRYRFPASNLDGEATLAGAKDEILRNFAMLQPLATQTPAAFDEVASSFLEAYLGGLSEGQAVDALKARVGDILEGLMAQTDDATLVDVARYLARAMDAAPQACLPIGVGHDLLRAAGVLARSDPDATAGTLVERILRGARTRGGAARVGMVRATGSARSRLASSCGEVRQAYAGILAHPEGRGASAFRTMLAASAATALQAGPIARE